LVEACSSIKYGNVPALHWQGTSGHVLQGSKGYETGQQPSNQPVIKEDANMHLKEESTAQADTRSWRQDRASIQEAIAEGNHGLLCETLSH
jgi:hypothetical protein